MPFASGQRVSSARLNRIQPTTYVASMSGGAITLTTSNQDLTGASITLSTMAANALYVASAVFDFESTATGVAIMQGRLSVDTVVQTEEALLDSNTGADLRATVAQQWRGTLASSGSHTLKLVAAKTAALGTSRVNAVHTTLTVVIYEVV